MKTIRRLHAFAGLVSRRPTGRCRDDLGNIKVPRITIRQAWEIAVTLNP